MKKIAKWRGGMQDFFNIPILGVLSESEMRTLRDAVGILARERARCLADEEKIEKQTGATAWPRYPVFVVMCEVTEWVQFIGCASTLGKAKDLADKHNHDYNKVPPILRWEPRDPKFDEKTIVCHASCGDKYVIRKVKVV